MWVVSLDHCLPLREIFALPLSWASPSLHIRASAQPWFVSHGTGERETGLVEQNVALCWNGVGVESASAWRVWGRGDAEAVTG